MTEQGPSRSKEDGCHMDLQLVDQSGLQRLLGDGGAATDDDVLAICKLSSPDDGLFHAVDELEARGRIGLFMNAMSHDDAGSER